MKKERKHSITYDLLKQYQDASLLNSQSLLKEAGILYKHGYLARAYYLACASIEETGKAYNAFSAQGRNLKNPGVQNAVKKSFEDHDSKIISAMACMARKVALDADKVHYLIDSSIHLQYGREKSMYVDIDEDNAVTLPNKVVRKKAAFDIIRLASDCLTSTSYYIKHQQPDKFLAHHDKFLVLNKSKLYKIMSQKDFWNYFIHVMRSEKNPDMTYAAVKYHDEYFAKNKLFSAGTSK